MDIKKFHEWIALQKALKEIKEKEMRLRKEICYEIFKSDSPPISKRVQTGNFIVDAKMDVNFSIDESILSQIFDELTDQDRASIKFKPGLKLKEYKALPKESLLHEAIIEKPSAPTLKVKERE